MRTVRTGWQGLVGAVALTLATGGVLAQAPQAPGSSEVVKLDHLRGFLDEFSKEIERLDQDDAVSEAVE